MVKTRSVDPGSLYLERRHRQPVDAFADLHPYFEGFLKLSEAQQQYELNGFAWDRESHGMFLNDSLETIYGYLYGSNYSSCHPRTNDELETRMLQTKTVLERNLIQSWLTPWPSSILRDQAEAAEYLVDFAEANPAIDHPLYSWLAEAAPSWALKTFIEDEVIQNETADFAVAKLAHGLPRRQRTIAVINLSSELWHGRFERASTNWLRLFIEQTDGSGRLSRRRTQGRPWFVNVINNVFKMTLTSSELKFAAYGHFIMTEALAFPNFEKLLKGMYRVGLRQSGSDNFTASAKLDPQCAKERIADLAFQEPAFSPGEIDQIIMGAHWAISAAQEQYVRVMKYLGGDCP